MVLNWQMFRLRGAPPSSVTPRCVLGRQSVAIFRRDAVPGAWRWQYFALVRPWAAIRGKFFASCIPKVASGRKKRPFLATYRRHASKTSWCWQDMRAMRPKSPANRLSGMHSAKILPGRGPFRCTDPSNHARRANLAIPGCFIWVLRARWGSGAKRRHQRR